MQCAGLLAGIYFGDRAGAYYARAELGASSVVQFQQIVHVHYARFMPGDGSSGLRSCGVEPQDVGGSSFMAKKILIALGVLCVVLLVAGVVISLRPGTFSVQRSVTVAAPPSKVFSQVDDLQAWDAWSPWKELDPNPKKAMSTPSAGKGATFTWAGNDKIGEGSLTILDSKPYELVDIEQVFIRPFAGKARMTFTFASMGDGTKVTWRMDGANNFIGKAMCMFMDMDAMLGKDFDRGLANMKSVVEKGGAEPAAATP